MRVYLRVGFLWARVCEYWFVIVDSALFRGRGERLLFVDVGANLGQGYSWFAQFYGRIPGIQFEMFEPNPYCVSKLELLPEVASGEVVLHKVGVGARAGKVPFYGLSEEEGGLYSVGGSILPRHNDATFMTPRAASESVVLIRFSDYLTDKATQFDRIICKMDIEGAELDVLEDLVDSDTIELIDVLYVEFHSRFLENAAETKKRENLLARDIGGRKKPRLRLWH